MSKFSHLFQTAWARHRLASHMYDRLIQGGSPDCPCGRCDRDREFLASVGKPWRHPEREMYYRNLERGLEIAGRSSR